MLKEPQYVREHIESRSKMCGEISMTLRLISRGIVTSPALLFALKMIARHRFYLNLAVISPPFLTWRVTFGSKILSLIATRYLAHFVLFACLARNHSPSASKSSTTSSREWLNCLSRIQSSWHRQLASHAVSDRLVLHLHHSKTLPPDHLHPPYPLQLWILRVLQ